MTGLVLCVLGQIPALADSASQCLRFDQQAQIAVGSLSVGQQSHARFIQEQAASIAAKLGAEDAPVLIRLKSNDPNVTTIAAYVTRPTGGLAVLLLYTSGQGQTHSLVDLPPTFVFGANEPDWHTPGREENRFSYSFYDEGRYHIKLGDFVSRPLKAGLGKGATYRQTVVTGYSYGGLPARCGQPN